MKKIFKPSEEIRQTPLQLLILAIVTIFIAESSIMLLMPYFNPSSVYLESIIDSILLITLIFPTLFYFSYRPILINISNYKQAVEDLRKAHENLEKLVEERTMMLKSTNEQLEREIYDHKTTEVELRNAKDKAVESDRLKSIFLGNMSHELRTPMIGILGYSQVLTNAISIEDAMEIGENIKLSGRRLMKTLDLIIDLSRFESGDMKLDMTHFDIISEIAEQIFLSKQNAEDKKLKISYYPKFEEFQLYSSLQVFMIVINHLISNAIKFTEEGGIAISVDREMVDEQWWVAIEVIDTGIGIEEKDIENIFKEFRQVSEGITRKYEGTGLGLTLTKKYIDLLGGNITVKSIVNVGSTFKVLIPIKN